MTFSLIVKKEYEGPDGLHKQMLIQVQQLSPSYRPFTIIHGLMIVFQMSGDKPTFF